MENLIMQIPLKIHYEEEFVNGEIEFKEETNFNEDIKNNLINYISNFRNISLKYNIVNSDYGDKIIDILILPKIDFIDKNYLGFIELKLHSNLSEKELLDVKNYLEWELSDGWGEGFEQIAFYKENINSLNIKSKQYFVHFWNSNNWYIKIKE